MVHRWENGKRRGEILQVEHGTKRSQRGSNQHGSVEFMRTRVDINFASGVFGSGGTGDGDE